MFKKNDCESQKRKTVFCPRLLEENVILVSRGGDVRFVALKLQKK